MELQSGSAVPFSAGAAAARKPSMAGSMVSTAGGAGGARRLVSDFEFSLGAAKTKVLKSLEESVPSAFVRFYSSSLFDRLLHGLVLYFCALFQQELLKQWTERSKTAHADGCNPALVASRVREVEEELNSRRSDLSQPYCEIIMKHSSYKNQQADKRFFESLYAALTAVLHEAFDKLQRRHVLEQELGRLFRGKHFNVAARVHGPQRSVDSMTVMQLYEVKNETGNRALHSQLISSLFEKAPSLSVQVASVSNTPLVSQAVSSPMVARSLLADPAERDALLALPYSRSPKNKGAVVSKPGVGLAAAAAAAGDGSGSPRHAAAFNSSSSSSPVLLLSSSSISAGAAAAGFTANTPGARGASTVGRPFQGVVALMPEAAGLPYDEHYSYLCLLRRSVLYGPTMGLPTGPPTTAGRSSMLSLTGAASASPGMLSHSNSVVFRM